MSDTIQGINFWSFKDAYSNPLVENSGISSYTITVKSYPADSDPDLVDASVKKVSCHIDCPVEIINLRNRIIELWDEEVRELWGSLLET